MNNRKVFLSILFPCFAMLLANCSAHVDGGSGDSVPAIPGLPTTTAPKADNVFDRPAIAGPDVIGSWQSACVEDILSSGTRQATLEFVSKTNFKYSNVSYADGACKTATKTETHEGLYEFTDKLSDILYGLDYNYVMDKVTYKMNGQRLEFDGDTLYISEFVFGNIEVDKQLPFKKSSASPAPTAGGTQPAPAPVTNCTNYSGSYQINSDYFSLAQTGCTKVDWTWAQTYDNPTATTLEYVTDGQAHTVGNKQVTATFDSHGHFTLAYKDQSDDVLEVYSFQKDPCNLMNPDGSDYLTRDVYIGGMNAPDECVYWVNR